MSKKIAILGTSGTLGHVLYDYLQSQFEVYGLTRDKSSLPFESDEKVFSCGPVQDIENWKQVLSKIKPDLVINAVGFIKQRESKGDSEQVYINSYFPHKLSEISDELNARFIHISTDCVFDGKKGNYSEEEIPNAIDIYGLSKNLGEVKRPPHVTIRTSIIGHELRSQRSLLEWFLNQEEQVNGYDQAFFSGFPTISLAKIIEQHFLDSDLTGLFHVASNKISKFDLLNLVKEVYAKEIVINRSSELEIDRSLNCELFKKKSGFEQKTWLEYIEEMKAFFDECEYYRGRR